MNKKSLPAPPRQDERPVASLARVSDRLNRAIEEAAAPGRLAADGRAVRKDGWTPERIRTFLFALAESGVAGDAARAAGMSRRSAFAFREREAGRAFQDAWDAALLLARRALADELMSRALHGCVEVIIRDGQVWGERHRYDNRTTMSVLARLDQHALSDDIERATARLIAGEYDEFVDIVCAGGEGAGEFLKARAKAEADANGKSKCIEVRFVSPKPE